MGNRTAKRDDGPAGLAGLRSAASAPAKCILLGEHAVVYGEPCLSVALARRTRVAVHRVGDSFRVNGYPLAKRHHAFIMAALDSAWKEQGEAGGPEPVRFEVESEVPSAGGIGSSAALTVATVAALRRLRGEWDPGDIANRSFEAEFAAQGRGSPNDTSVSTAGGCVFLAPEESRARSLSPLWRIERDENRWFVHRAPAPVSAFAPEVKWVVGHTGIHAVTRRQVEKVARFVKKSGFGKDTIRELGALTWQGLDALGEGDAEGFGRIMDRAHSHLVTLGVSHPDLERLVEAARRTPGTLGAKLTGAGGGGAMVVLTSEPMKAAKALEKAGARSFLLTSTLDGVQAEPGLEGAEAAPAGNADTGRAVERSAGGGAS